MRSLDVIKPVLSEVEGTADWILDLGPEGGVKGGEIVAQGTPEQVAAEERSFTGSYLRPLLERGASQHLPPGGDVAPNLIRGDRGVSAEPKRTRRRKVAEAARVDASSTSFPNKFNSQC